ncbi:hypothetical protein B0H13DRAFT_2558970 [Mycena leptocephala]|nr:hypothetical protein B0H13DRAFT_2558970 [Mycena leptocephala]
MSIVRAREREEPFTAFPPRVDTPRCTWSYVGRHAATCIDLWLSPATYMRLRGVDAVRLPVGYVCLRILLRRSTCVYIGLRSKLDELAEQLKVYYNSDWQRTSNITKATTAQARQALMKQVHNPNRLLMVPPVPQTIPKLHHAPVGMLSLRTIDQTLTLTPRRLLQDLAMICGGSTGAKAGATTGVPCRDNAAAGEDMQQSEPLLKKPRKDRTCRKCALDSCPGKAKVDYCCNTCKDCGKQGQDKSCRGRNPKFPTKTCREAAGTYRCASELHKTKWTPAAVRAAQNADSHLRDVRCFDGVVYESMTPVSHHAGVGLLNDDDDDNVLL